MLQNVKRNTIIFVTRIQRKEVISDCTIRAHEIYDMNQVCLIHKHHIRLKTGEMYSTHGQPMVFFHTWQSTINGKFRKMNLVFLWGYPVSLEVRRLD